MSRYLLLLFVIISWNATAQGIEFFEGSWEEVLAVAKEEKKEVFVDIYTTWCGPCKKLDQTTFKDPKLSNYINENFIPFKVEAEHGPDRDIAYAFGIGGYPVMIFFDAYGIQKIQARGFKKPEALLALAKYAQNTISSDDKLIGLFNKDKADLSKEELSWIFEQFNLFHNPDKQSYMIKLHALLSDAEREKHQYDFIEQYPLLSEDLKDFYVEQYARPSLYDPNRMSLLTMEYDVGKQIEQEYKIAFSAKDEQAFRRILKRRMDFAIKARQIGEEERQFLEDGYLEQYTFKQANREKGY
jgi:thiol-disulfide isomerase/thioredoxin